MASPDGSLGVISQELCSSQARAGFGLSSVDSTGEVAPAERVVHGVHRGGPAPRASAFQCAASDGAGGPVAPVGEPWSRCRDPLSVSPKAARRFDAGQFVEIEIDNGLQRLAGGAIAQGLGQRIEPSSILSLEPEQCGRRGPSAHGLDPWGHAIAAAG